MYQSFTINTHEKYQVIIEAGLFSKLDTMLAEHFADRKLAIITDKKIMDLYVDELTKKLYQSQLPYKIIMLSSGEENKSLSVIPTILQPLMDFSLNRDDLIIAFGGGVIGDISGFVSSIYMRGVDLLHLPTTLLAQVDSALGGKNGLNYGGMKNMIGSFYQPIAVWSDPLLTESLSALNYDEAMSAVINSAGIKAS